MPWTPWGNSWLLEDRSRGPGAFQVPSSLSLSTPPATPHSPASTPKPQSSSMLPHPPRQQQARTRHLGHGPPSSLSIESRVDLASSGLTLEREGVASVLIWSTWLGLLVVEQLGLTWKKEDGWDMMEQASSVPAGAPTEGYTPRTIAGERFWSRVSWFVDLF